MISEFLRPTGLNSCRAPEKDSTVFGSMTSSVFVLYGKANIQSRWKLSTITEGVTMKTEKIFPLHPGEVLFDEFLQPLRISQNQIARDLGVSPRRINEIVHGKRSITADTALRLSLYFGNSAQFWMGLQMDYDLDMAKDKSLEKIKGEVTHSKADTIKAMAAGGEAGLA